MKIDGREFEGTNQQITAAQNDYIIGHLRVAGALEVLAQLDPKHSEESIEKAREQLVTRIYLSGRKAQILAGVLTEVGKRWSRAEADRNAARFEELTDAEDIQTMTAALVRTVIDFFASVGKSSASSPKSSTPNVADVPNPSADLASSESSVH
jgi:hypothetical protein